jgi:hypothetical protein
MEEHAWLRRKGLGKGDIRVHLMSSDQAGKRSLIANLVGNIEHGARLRNTEFQLPMGDESSPAELKIVCTPVCKARDKVSSHPFIYIVPIAYLSEDDRLSPYMQLCNSTHSSEHICLAFSHHGCAHACHTL